MDESFFQRILTKIGVAILIIATLDLLYLNYWVIKGQKSDAGSRPTTGPLRSEASGVGKSEEKLDQVSPSPKSLVSPLAVPSAEPKTEVKTVETKTIVEKESQTIVQTAQKEIFIPIGSGSTFSNSYIDLAGLEVSIDSNKYSDIESVVFEASIWVQDGNGKMYAQLYNSTDSHPVWNSEISTSASKAVLTTSPKINLTTGNKTYKVQAKTNLTSYAAHVDNARIKITLK